MKKTKLMHALLALALSYGTFVSEAMAYNYDTFLDTQHYNYTDLYKDGVPSNYTQVSADQIVDSENPWLTGDSTTQEMKDDALLYIDGEGRLIIGTHQSWGINWNVYSSSDAATADPAPTLALTPEPIEPAPAAPAPAEPTTAEEPTMPDPMAAIQPTHSVNLAGAQNAMYSPSLANIASAGNVTQAMQNIAQNAYATNNADLMNNMNVAGNIQGSDIYNNMTVNTNAMNSNVGSSYNNSTNNITTNTENSSINDYTTTLNSSRHFTQLP